MLGRRLAVTFVKKNPNSTDQIMDTTSFEQITDKLVETAAGIGTVVVVVASTLTALRITEHVVKHIFR